MNHIFTMIFATNMCLLQLFFFEPDWTLLAANLYMLSTPNSLPSMEHSISKFAAAKASLLLNLRDLVADFGILSAKTCTPISQYTHPWDCVAKLECLTVVFLARECVTTPPQLCRYCPLWGPYPSWFCSSPGCAGEKASTH